jgi:hypothetical protein
MLTIDTDAEGAETWTFTRQGAALAREMAMTAGEDEGREQLKALLDATQAGMPDT